MIKKAESVFFSELICSSFKYQVSDKIETIGTTIHVTYLYIISGCLKGINDQLLSFSNFSLCH